MVPQPASQMFHNDDHIRTDSIDIEHLNENQTKSNLPYDRYINRIAKVLNKRGKDDLCDLCKRNE